MPALPAFFLLLASLSQAAPKTDPARLFYLEFRKTGCAWKTYEPDSGRITHYLTTPECPRDIAWDPEHQTVYFVTRDKVYSAPWKKGGQAALLRSLARGKPHPDAYMEEHRPSRCWFSETGRLRILFYESDGVTYRRLVEEMQGPGSWKTLSKTVTMLYPDNGWPYVHLRDISDRPLSFADKFKIDSNLGCPVEPDNPARCLRVTDSLNRTGWASDPDSLGFVRAGPGTGLLHGFDSSGDSRSWAAPLYYCKEHCKKRILVTRDGFIGFSAHGEYVLVRREEYFDPKSQSEKGDSERQVANRSVVYRVGEERPVFSLPGMARDAGWLRGEKRLFLEEPEDEPRSPGPPKIKAGESALWHCESLYHKAPVTRPVMELTKSSGGDEFLGMCTLPDERTMRPTVIHAPLGLTEPNTPSYSPNYPAFEIKGALVGRIPDREAPGEAPDRWVLRADRINILLAPFEPRWDYYSQGTE